MPLEEEIGNYIFTQLVSGENLEKLDNDDDLFEKDILDSLAFVGLVSHLEEVYRIEVETGEMVAENFGSIRRLAGFVKRKLENR